jgi:3-oxoacyl-[acyl-carrier protein] reductase
VLREAAPAANCVALGVIETGIFLRLRETAFTRDDVEAMRRNTPLRRFGTAADAAEAVCFLASSRASFITGQTLAVDGGYSV